MDYELLGLSIRAERKKRGLTQAQLAEAADISISFIGHIERGTRVLSLETLVRLALALHCSLDALVGLPGLAPMDKKERMLSNLEEVMRYIEGAP